MIEDARIDLARAVLAIREGENEPEFNLPEDTPNHSDEESVTEFRQEIIGILSDFDLDELRPAEQRCRRIRALADSKGISSLTTIVDKPSAVQQHVELSDPAWADIHRNSTASAIERTNREIK